MTGVKPTSNENEVLTIAAVLFSVILILGMGTGLPFQEKQQQEVFAQGAPSTNKAPTTFASVCNPNSPLIKLGSTGAKVVELQDFLTQLGYGSLLGQNSTDGKFTAFTKIAVKKFQQDTGLQPVDGIVGQKTWNALCSAISNRQQQQAAQEPPTQAPAQVVPEATIYRVTFHSIIINENHDTTSFGTAEWKLTAWVNGQARLLETCEFLSGSKPDEKVDCNDQMYNVKDHQSVAFPSLYTDVKIGKGGAIDVLVNGIDLDGETWVPPSIPQNVQAALRIASAAAVATGGGALLNPVIAIELLTEVIDTGGTIVSWIASLDDNDKLGQIHKMYRGPNYETYATEFSNTRDYVLKYSIKALSPADAYYSHAEPCEPPKAASLCIRLQP